MLDVKKNADVIHSSVSETIILQYYKKNGSKKSYNCQIFLKIET